MTIYLAGPMRGYPRYNHDAFAFAATTMRKMGYEVVNPAEFDLVEGFDIYSLPDNFDWYGLPAGFDLHACIRRDVDALLRCDRIVMLTNWERSAGARAEYSIAWWANIPWLEFLPVETLHKRIQNA